MIPPTARNPATTAPRAKFPPNDMRCALPRPARGERVGVRGSIRRAESEGQNLRRRRTTRIAQNRGEAPSPSFASLSRPLPARGERRKTTLSSLRGANATKQSRFPRKPLDCFAHARNDDARSDLATRLRARALLTTTLRKNPASKRGRRSAERRMTAIAAQSAAARRFEGAPAFRRFTAAFTTGYHPDGSAPEPGFPKARRIGVLPVRRTTRLELSTLRADRSFCRPTGDPEPPGCGSAIPPAGTASHSASQVCLSGKAPSVSGTERM
jgi:hypothetical protein